VNALSAQRAILILDDIVDAVIPYATIRGSVDGETPLTDGPAEATEVAATGKPSGATSI
jgi:hypothetical protein